MANEDFQNGFIVGLSSRGSPISENGTTEVIEQVQTDWNQNDGDAVDYIKNRPIYKEIKGTEVVYHKLEKEYLPDEILEIPTQVDDLYTAIEDLEASLSTLPSEVYSKSEVDGLIEASNSSLSQEISNSTAALQEDIDGNSSAIDEVKKSLESANNSITSISGQVSTLESGLEDLNTHTEEELRKLNTSIEELSLKTYTKEEIDAKDTTLANSITSSAGALQESIDNVTEKITKVETDLGETNNSLEALSSNTYSKDEVNSKESALNDKIQANTDIITSLEENTYSKEEVDTKVTLFHATLDPITTQYIKDSGDFTYADVLATENCKIEASFGNVTIIFNKEIIRNMEPDPVTGRYVEFSALLRNGLTTIKVFLFVYDPEYLPTDPVSLEKLADWGDSQYCGIEVQHILIGDFLDGDIVANRYSTLNAPSTKAAGDYTDAKCNAVLEYMQTTFVENMLALGDMRYPAAPTILYYDANGFEATNSSVGDDWNLEGMDFTPYKRLKFYVAANGSTNDNYTPSHVVEMDLDDKAKNYKDYYVAGHTAQNPNNANRLHNVTFAVSADKTKVQFARATSLYGTASTASAGGRICYKIEGYIY